MVLVTTTVVTAPLQAHMIAESDEIGHGLGCSSSRLDCTVHGVCQLYLSTASLQARCIGRLLPDQLAG